MKASIRSRLRSSPFAPQEIALLRMADAMADTPSNVSDELYGELRKHFSEEQLIELAASAALENLRARSEGSAFQGAAGGLIPGNRYRALPVLTRGGFGFA